MSILLHRILTLARVSNLPTVWSNCLAAWFISGADVSWELLPLLIGSSLLYAGGCTLNDAFDAKWDGAHRPERLIPSGQMATPLVWGIGACEMVAGVVLTLAGGFSYLWPALGLAACILLYDAWHKQSPLSVITMGACRWLLYVTAASAAGIGLQKAMISGGVVWLYIIVLSLVARGEAKRNAGAGSGRWWLLLLIIPFLLLGLIENAGDYEMRGRLMAGLLFGVGLALLLPWHSRNVGHWVNRLLAGIPVLDLALVIIALESLGCGRAWLAVFPAAIVLSLLFQRWFKAT